MRILRALSDWWRRLTRGGKRAETRAAERPDAEGARTNGDAVRPSGGNTAQPAPEPVSGAAVEAPRRRPEGEDDLTAIRGIGEATQRRLHAAGIRSYADLARATPGEIHDALIGSRRGVRVEQWIAQARRLSEKAGPPAR